MAAQTKDATQEAFMLEGPQTTMRVALSDRQLMYKVRMRLAVDPAFRRLLEEEFSQGGRLFEPKDTRDSATGGANRVAHINSLDLSDQTKVWREVIMPQLSTILDPSNQNRSDTGHSKGDSPAKKRCEARELAERLLECKLPGPNGTLIEMKRAEIERFLRKTLGISRNAAQSASNRAVKARDPGNPARQSRKAGIGRRASPVIIQKIRSLEGKLLMKDIAKVVGCDQRTVWKYRKNRGRYRLLSR